MTKQIAIDMARKLYREDGMTMNIQIVMPERGSLSLKLI